MRRILITGINGVIGSTIAKLLSEENKIIGTSIEKENTTDITMDYFQTDISERDSLSVLPKDVDAIVHCAAVINYDNMSTLLIDANCKGVQNIAHYAKSTTCSQFVYFSSLPVIGMPKVIPITEEHPINPPTVYHITKYFGEKLLIMLLKDINLSIFRIPSPIGKNTPSNKIVPVFVKNAIDGKDFVLKGRGNRIQNYIDLRDIARAVECAIENNTNGVFNIASERSYSNKELAEICISLFNSNSKIRFEGEDSEEEYQWIVSTGKAKSVLGFEAIYKIEDTLKDIASNYIE